ncbi:MAG: aminoacyl-tRNA hydrolase [Alphaproteobacteria bacterium]|nr:aminoacyl-tRNA hydrolase [Alphaproteobacteria bacterium]
MFLFVGLGNPGPKHAGQRHNIGFMAVDEIARRHGFSAFRARFQGLISEGTIAGQLVRLLKPMTFMNESGRSVGEALRFFKLRTPHVYTFYDDLDLKPGKCRVKIGGGAGGHNGLRSMDSHISKEYWRVRLGIGHPGHKDKVHAYVLQDFVKAERTSWLPKLLDAAADDAGLLVQGEENAFMSRMAQAVFPPPPKPPKPANVTQDDDSKLPLENIKMVRNKNQQEN